MRKSKAVLFAASFVLAMSQHPAFAQKAIFSDGFETSYDGWTFSGDLTEIKAVPGAGYNMSRGMKITNRGAPQDGAIAEKGFYLDGGEEYNYSVFVKHNQPAAETFNLNLRWLYPDGSRYESKVIASAEAKPGVWTKLSTTFTAPQSTVNLTISITTNSTADFYFDNVDVTQNGYFGITPHDISPAPGDKSLKNVYANYFRVGNILNGTTVNNNTIKALILREYNSITMENEMKPDATIRQSGSTNENILAQINTSAAAILKFCVDNNIAVRGHVLVWHGQSPRWFFTSNLQNPSDPGNTNSVSWASKAVMEKRLETYITNIFKLIKEQYPNVNLYAYDVVNEAVATCNNVWGARCPGYDFKGAGGVDQTAEGNSPWAKIYGNNDFIESAFKYAKAARDQYFPNCKLFYNDYNEWDPPKRDHIISQILTPLKNKGYLDGMGMQGHIDANTGGWSSVERCTTAMAMYAKLGIDVQITELDIGMKGYTAQQQADRYKGVFEKAININGRGGGKFTAIVIWGPSDGNSWRNDNNATLHDADVNPKTAYNTLVNLLPQNQWSDGDNPPCCVVSAIRSSSSVTPSSSSSSVINVNATCNVNNLNASYTAGSSVPRPNVSCGAGVAVGAASFSIGGAEIEGWSSPGGTHELWNPGVRTVVLNSLACNGSTVTPNPPVTCGSFEIVSEATPIANGSTSVSISFSVRYYTIKGEPLGSIKPAKPGVYLVKQGNSVRKIVVR